jgi:hypothetical protein
MICISNTENLHEGAAQLPFLRAADNDAMIMAKR